MRFQSLVRFAPRLAVLLLAGLAGCTAVQTRSVVEDPGGLSSSAEVAGIPFFPQQEYYCGPAALGMALAWSGLSVTQEEVARHVYTPGAEGTFRNDLLAGARRYGRLATRVEGLRDLLAEVEAGHPVIVFQNLALRRIPKWHFAVVVGYDLDARQVILHSGLEERLAINMDAFERTWARGDYWGLVVLPPGRLPATGGRSEVLRAAAGIERANRLQDAAIAYATIADRWPDLWLAHMGLGNVRYARGEFAAAESAYRTAVAAAPEEAAAWNNLAYALAAQDRNDEAVAAARQAVALAGQEDAEGYRDTIRDVSAD